MKCNLRGVKFDGKLIITETTNQKEPILGTARTNQRSAIIVVHKTRRDSVNLVLCEVVPNAN